MHNYGTYMYIHVYTCTHSTFSAHTDAPPPKPKRPPKELMSKLAQNESTENVTLETKIRTRTASFFKSM